MTSYNIALIYAKSLHDAGETEMLARFIAANSEHITLGRFMDTGAVCAWIESREHAGDDMTPVFTGWAGEEQQS